MTQMRIPLLFKCHFSVNIFVVSPIAHRVYAVCLLDPKEPHRFSRFTWCFLARIYQNWSNIWLVVCCFTSRSRIFHSYRDVIIAVKDCKIDTYALWAWRDLYSATPAVTRSYGFAVSSEGLRQFSGFLLQTRGNEDLFYPDSHGN